MLRFESSIPVRVVNTITQDEILSYQLTKNLQREDLNSMDQAKGIFTYIQAKHPDKGYDVNGVMSKLVSYKRRPEDLSDKIAPTVGAII
jgi:ParB-like chromosome segregation protein Spo0J